MCHKIIGPRTDYKSFLRSQGCHCKDLLIGSEIRSTTSMAAHTLDLFRI